MKTSFKYPFTGIVSLFLFTGCALFQKASQPAIKPDDSFLPGLLAKYPQFFDSIIKQKEAPGIQVIYTEIDRDKKGRVRFTDHRFQTDTERYFYPASTVKLPVAILALQRLNELKIPGLNRNTAMITESAGEGQTQVCNDPTSATGSPSIAHYIKKILLVSDNDAFNRLYEFLGQEYINTTLQKMGFTSAQIIHRLSISLTEEQNRHTNPVEFYGPGSGDPGNIKLIYKKPAEISQLVYAGRNTKMGRGFIRNDKLISEPFDFSKKNRLSLEDLHQIVRSVMFPEAVPRHQRFNLEKDDYDFLRKYMSMLPRESGFPLYDTTEYHDNYVKFLYYGAEKTRQVTDNGNHKTGQLDTVPAFRIFNKVGNAYGFLVDGAYFADFKNKIEFQLSAVIYCNSDGIFNDDRYDYESVGFPFLKNLGRVIYDHESRRPRAHFPNLSPVIFQYAD